MVEAVKQDDRALRVERDRRGLDRVGMAQCPIPVAYPLALQFGVSTAQRFAVREESRNQSSVV
ncbi:MAG: hypothetical protein WBE69_10960, partial [Candidatus Binataceae bacterium]